MELHSRSTRRGSVEGHEGGMPSKRHRTAEEEKREGFHTRGRSYDWVLAEEEAEMDTSFGSEYMAGSSGCSGSSGASASLEVESEFVEGLEAGDDVEVKNSRRGKQIIVVPQVEVLWRSFEEANLMDSSGNDFGQVDSRGENSTIVSLVEESEISEHGWENGRGMRGGGECAEGEDSGWQHNDKKVVPGQERRMRRKAAGDGVVVVGPALKGETSRAVNIRGRCTLERVVSLNERMTAYQREVVMGSVL